MEENIFLNERMNLEYETKKTLNDRGNIEIEMPEMVKSNMEEPQSLQPVPAADGGVGVDISSLTSSPGTQQQETGPEIEPPEKELTTEELAGEIGYGDEEQEGDKDSLDDRREVGKFQSQESKEVSSVVGIDYSEYHNLERIEKTNYAFSAYMGKLVEDTNVGGGEANVFVVADRVIYTDGIVPEEECQWRLEDDDGNMDTVSTANKKWTIPSDCPVIEGKESIVVEKYYTDDVVCLRIED